MKTSTFIMSKNADEAYMASSCREDSENYTSKARSNSGEKYMSSNSGENYAATRGNDNEDYVLKIRTTEGHNFKILIELLKICVKEVCFVVNLTGITVTCVDANKKKLVYVDLKSEYFTSFITQSHELHIGVNVHNLYSMIRTMKKKDIITLYIKKDKPTDLMVDISQYHNVNPVTSFVKTIEILPFSTTIPDSYGRPVSVTSKEFQNLKTINKISKNIAVNANSKVIKFYCDKEGMSGKFVVFGDPSANVRDESEFIATYETEILMRIVKVCSLSVNVLIFTNTKAPLKIRLSVGTLGTTDIFIMQNKETTRS